ncbi:short-chain fatty acyl-CoA regulator family protein [Yoonia sp. 208BN28-4]|uniref:short-chain fatty acyl-CoA regulator family protein n=1 Tax=Yoonia sp. 208BN28-4 TaxID=3126505 RepID=UPI0030972033
MAHHAATGSRIRDRRMDQGIRQADLAQGVGISPSYLNLIEHNKRRIGGKLLTDLARALDIDAGMLTDGADLALVDQLRSAAAEHETAQAEVDRIEEWVARYPGWAAVMDHQARRIAQLETQVRNMSDRMAHDPQLASALHDVISAVTSIRSTAGILVDDDRIDRDWQQRFHRNIHDESVRLAEESEALIAYLDAPKAELAHRQSPFEEASAHLGRTGFRVPELEADPDADTTALAKGIALSSAAQILLAQWFDVYASLIRQMPLAPFAKAAHACGHDPLTLSQTFGARLVDVLKRLASLPVEDGHPPMALVSCDAAGVTTFLKPAAGFTQARQGGNCPLWPLYQALTQPGQVIRADVVLPDSAASRFLCFAATDQGPISGYDAAPLLQATMLVFPDPPQTGLIPRPVGLTCRICPREGCAARREPAVA